MISDVMSDSVSDLDRYLGDSFYDGWYNGDLRREIVDVRNRMEMVRARLDGGRPFLMHGERPPEEFVPDSPAQDRFVRDDDEAQGQIVWHPSDE